MKYSITKRINPLKRDEVKFYATADYGDEIDIRMLAEEISKSCTLTVPDVVAVIESLLDKMPLYLKNSNKVRLGNFGIFKLSFSAEGQEKMEDVSAKDIKNLRGLFTPSTHLKKELSDVSYSKR